MKLVKNTLFSNFFKFLKKLVNKANKRFILYLVLIFLLFTIFFLFYKNVLYKRDFINLNTNLYYYEDDLRNYELLISYFNKIITNVYYGYAEFNNSDGSLASSIKSNHFTAFSLFYNNNYYLITAGHCIENNEIKYSEFKFIGNFKRNWIYPKLLFYNNDYSKNLDYAVFSSPLIKSGLIASIDNNDPKYIIGSERQSKNILRKFNTSVYGESGSPILNSECKVIGIVIKNSEEFTPINVVLASIDSFKK